MPIKRLLGSTAIVLAAALAAPAVVSAEGDAAAVESAAPVDIDVRRAEMNSSMEAWRARIDERRGENNAVEETLEAAWSQVEMAWADVENATEENWNEASEAFDAAMEGLDETWDDLTDESGT